MNTGHHPAKHRLPLEGDDSQYRVESAGLERRSMFRPDAILAADVAGERPIKSQLSVLHLEDNAEDAELILDALESEDFTCHVVRAQTREQFEAAL